MDHEAVVAYVDETIRFFDQYHQLLHQSSNMQGGLSEELNQYKNTMIQVVKANVKDTLDKLREIKKELPPVIKELSLSDLLPEFLNNWVKQSTQQPTVQQPQAQQETEQKLQSAVIKTTRYLLRAKEVLEQGVVPQGQAACDAILAKYNRLLSTKIVQDKSWLTSDLRDGWMYARIALLDQDLSSNNFVSSAEKLKEIAKKLDELDSQDKLSPCRRTNEIGTFQFQNVKSSLAEFRRYMAEKPALNSPEQISRAIRKTAIR